MMINWINRWLCTSLPAATKADWTGSESLGKQVREGPVITLPAYTTENVVSN